MFRWNLDRLLATTNILFGLNFSITSFGPAPDAPDTSRQKNRRCGAFRDPGCTMDPNG